MIAVEVMLKSKVLKVVGFNRRTRAKMFENLRIGDLLLLSIPVKAVGRGSRGNSYAPCITVKNLITDEEVYITFNYLPRLLNCFILEEEVLEDESGQIFL